MTDKYVPAPADYITLQGKKYLPARRRVQWFRGDHPDWTITTSVVELDWTAGHAIIRADVLNDTGRLISSGMKSETRKGFADFVEKAETGAIARAVAIAGYGTEDALDLDEGGIADSPVKQPERDSGRPSAEGRTASSPAVTPASASYRRDELAALMREKDLTLEAIEVYANLVGIPKGQRATDSQMDALIDAVRGHGVDEVIEPAARAGELSEPEEVSPASGAPPPKPGTPEYNALPSGVERSAAKAHWDAQKAAEPHQESLAEQLGAPA